MSDGLYFHTNLNDTAIGTLTEHGVLIYKKYYESLNLSPPELVNNEISTQLWDLMNIFGSSLYNGSKQVFVNNSLKIERIKY